jgi:hypothetical protein
VKERLIPKRGSVALDIFTHLIPSFAGLDNAGSTSFTTDETVTLAARPVSKQVAIKRSCRSTSTARRIDGEETTGRKAGASPPATVRLGGPDPAVRDTRIAGHAVEVRLPASYGERSRAHLGERRRPWLGARSPRARLPSRLSLCRKCATDLAASAGER